MKAITAPVIAILNVSIRYAVFAGPRISDYLSRRWSFMLAPPARFRGSLGELRTAIVPGYQGDHVPSQPGALCSFGRNEPVCLSEWSLLYRGQCQASS
jgi:hypothetical protein